jgi:hypothetical protein
MTAEDDADRLIEQYHLALGEFVKGNPKPVKELFSHGEDVSLANPLGPPARGWEQVAQVIERAASNFGDGEMVAFEYVAKYVTPELAYAVWLERANVKMGGMEDFAPIYPAGYDGLSTRGWHLEGCPPARRPHNHSSASRVGTRGVELAP